MRRPEQPLPDRDGAPQDLRALRVACLVEQCDGEIMERICRRVVLRAIYPLAERQSFSKVLERLTEAALPTPHRPDVGKQVQLDRVLSAEPPDGHAGLLCPAVSLGKPSEIPPLDPDDPRRRAGGGAI